ncbi:LLM class flavin-dependent oxidoreductase [Bhargavaea ginsengi]|uniref:LLM class flavin-dependent oxidoreductase n=1 Tax=Bhargavaea ginsengi TaxID=426757 RepID=UPI00204237BD|nr:LLM class flavin-dependent oxidoreductase [Bhargavaea ginsengi]MCM3087802.1 LLM class flavin-dependent oxidoreductase [Bhargavaea ginsengi]
MSYQLGILDQSPVFPGASAEHALQQTVQLAQQAEKWGYSRFWVSEHHHSQDVAGSSPEVLVSHLLAKTESIRIGSGGVMLQHYSPFKVAENFHLMSALAPGRVDLGIGKAPGGLPLSTKALQFGTVNDGTDFAERLAHLMQLIRDEVPEAHPLAGIQATPLPSKRPDVHLLGASPDSARLAARLGIGFVFALFINNNRTVLEKSAAAYRELHPGGTFIAAAHVLAAPTQAEAENLAGDYKIIKVHLQNGRSFTLTSTEAAHSFGRQAGVPYEVEELKADIIAGTPDYVHQQLAQLHEAYRIDEFILHTALPKVAERARSFRLLGPHLIPASDSSTEKSEIYR